MALYKSVYYYYYYTERQKSSSITTLDSAVYADARQQRSYTYGDSDVILFSIYAS